MSIKSIHHPSPTVQPPQHILHHLLRPRPPPHIRRQAPPLPQIPLHRPLYFPRRPPLPQKLQHQPHAPNHRNRVRNPPPLNIRRRPMARLPDHEPIAHVRTGDEPQRAHQRGGAVGEDVPVEVGRDDDVVGGRGAEELVDHAVDDLLLDADAVEGGEGGARGFAEEAVGLGEDVAFVGDGHGGGCVDAFRCGSRGGGGAELLSSDGDFAGHVCDPAACARAYPLDGFGDGALPVGRGEGALFLDVEVLGVLPHDDEVDFPAAVRFHAADALHGPDVGVEIELFAEGDDGGGVAFDFGGGGGDGAEEGGVAVGAEVVDGGGGKRGAGLLEVGVAAGEGGEVEGEGVGFGEGFEYAAAGLGRGRG